MNKNDMFRKINERFPDIVEKAITLWGTPELDVYILDTVSDMSIKPREGLTPEIMEALSGLKGEHDREYPQFVAEGNAEAIRKLEENPDFKKMEERFPHIGRRVKAAWGHASFPLYIDGLFNDNRGGKRQGFPEEIVTALFHLTQLHDLEYPQFERKVADLWAGNNAW